MWDGTGPDNRVPEFGTEFRPGPRRGIQGRRGTVHARGERCAEKIMYMSRTPGIE